MGQRESRKREDWKQRRGERGGRGDPSTPHPISHSATSLLLCYPLPSRGQTLLPGACSKTTPHPLIRLNGFDFVFVFVLFSVQKNKIKTWEQRACHPTQGCIHTVRKIMKGLYDRVKRCGDHATSGPPQTLLQLKPESSWDLSPCDERQIKHEIRFRQSRFMWPSHIASMRVLTRSPRDSSLKGSGFYLRGLCERKKNDKRTREIDIFLGDM